MWEVSWKPNRTAAYWPPLLWPLQRFFLILLGCSTGGLGVQPLGDLVLIPVSSLQLQLINRGPEGPLGWVLVLSTTPCLQLTWTSCRRGYITIWRPLFFLRASQFRTHFNPSTVKAAPDLLISSTGCTCYLHKCISYFENLAGSEVNIQHLKL